MFEAIRSRITVVGDCWLWQGAKDRHGYGQIRRSSGLYSTHRVMCEAEHGPAPPGKPFALHSCDTPACCNPKHLSWGNRSRNVRENRDRLGTQATQKLTREQAYAIKYLEDYTRRGAQARVAEKYGVSRVTVNHILKGRQWSDI